MTNPAPLDPANHAAFVARLPKAELHVHFGGNFRWDTIRAFHPEGMDLPAAPPWLDETGRASFADFSLFREIFFRYVRPACATTDALEAHTADVLLDLAAQNVRYVELIFGPRFLMGERLTMPQVFAALEAGRTRANEFATIDARFILGLNRHEPAGEVFEMLREVAEIAGPRGSGLVVGIDLQGDERMAATRDFAAMFDFAREQGMRLNAHAGELAGADSVREAVEILGVEHISHGVRAIEDAALVADLAARGTFLHVCPTSNICLGVYPSMAAHPLGKLLAAGCCVTVNSDDPLVFGASLTDEFCVCLAELGLTVADVERLALAAVDASLLPEAERRAMVREIAAACTTGGWG